MSAEGRSRGPTFSVGMRPQGGRIEARSRGPACGDATVEMRWAADTNAK